MQPLFISNKLNMDIKVDHKCSIIFCIRNLIHFFSYRLLHQDSRKGP